MYAIPILEHAPKFTVLGVHEHNYLPLRVQMVEYNPNSPSSLYEVQVIIHGRETIGYVADTEYAAEKCAKHHYVLWETILGTVYQQGYNVGYDTGRAT